MYEQDRTESGERCAEHQENETFGVGMLNPRHVIHQRIILAGVQRNINAWTDYHARIGTQDYQPRIIERSV